MSLMNTMFDEQLLLNADPDTSGNALPYRQKSSKYMGFVILFLIAAVRLSLDADYLTDGIQGDILKYKAYRLQAQVYM